MIKYQLKRKAREILQNFSVSHYQQYMVHFVRPTQQTAMEALQLKAGSRILEVGVGNGSSVDLYPQGIALTGIDLSASLIEEVQKKAKRKGLVDARFFVMNAQNLRAFENNSFDGVLSCSLLSVVPNPEKAYSEMVRVCRPGGRIAVTSHFIRATGWQKHLDFWISPWVRKALGYQTRLSEELILKNEKTRFILREDHPIGPYIMNTAFVVEKTSHAEAP